MDKQLLDWYGQLICTDPLQDELFENWNLESPAWLFLFITMSTCMFVLCLRFLGGAFVLFCSDLICGEEILSYYKGWSCVDSTLPNSQHPSKMLTFYYYFDTNIV